MSSTLQIWDPDGDLTFVFSIAETIEDAESETAQKDAVEMSNKDCPRSEVRHVLGQALSENSVTYSEVRFQVSSKHMMLASPVFKAMLKSSFAEGQALQVNGRVEVPLDDDHFAFAIIMDIIHGRGRRVPKIVSLKLLAQLAALVDKYSFEAVDVFSDSWILGLENTIDSSSHVELFYWISISYVFRRGSIFKRTTKIVFMRLSKSDCDEALATIEQEHDLPLPIRALDHITEQRAMCFRDIYQMIDREIEFYTTSTSKHRCKKAGEFYGEQQELCDALVLGSLLRSLTSKTLMWPMSDEVCNKLSWKALLREVGTIKITSACNGMEYGKDRHGVVLSLLKTINAVPSLTGGLDLEVWT